MSRPCYLAFCLASLAFACASEPADSGHGGSDAGESGASAGGSGGNLLPESCPEGTFPGTSEEPVMVGVVSGAIVDQQGQPTTAGLVQVCAKNLCVDAHVGDDGKFVKNIAADMESTACKLGDGREWGKLAFPIGAGDTDVGSLIATRLPDFADGAELLAGSTVSSGGVSLSLTPDAIVDIDELVDLDETEFGFRAAELPAESIVQLGQDFVAAYALAPLETAICPSPALSVDNTPGLEPGTELELYIQGLDVSEHFAPYGGWEKVADGQVSTDGATLDFPDGLPLLTVIGIRVKN